MYIKVTIENVMEPGDAICHGGCTTRTDRNPGAALAKALHDHVMIYRTPHIVAKLISESVQMEEEENYDEWATMSEPAEAILKEKGDCEIQRDETAE